MARTRSIKPGFFMNEELAELPCEARLLFIGLWTIADREGRLEDRPRKIKAAVFPYDQCDVDGLLGQLARKGFVRRYELKSGRYIHINNFAKHQKPHPREAPSEIPVWLEDEGEPSESRDWEVAGCDGEEASCDGEGASCDGEGASCDGEGAGRDGEGAPTDTSGRKVSHARMRAAPGAGRDGEAAGREKDEGSREKVGRGRETPDFGKYRAGSDREKNGAIHARAFLTKDMRKEEGKDTSEQGMKEDTSEQGMREDTSEQGMREGTREEGMREPGEPTTRGVHKFAQAGGKDDWDGAGRSLAIGNGAVTGNGAARGGRPYRASKVETGSGVRTVFEYWREKMGHLDAKLTREREMKIKGRLEEGYTVDQLKTAVDGCRGSSFHQGDNERGHRYDDITLICRSGSKLEQFIEMTKEVGDERRQSRKRSNVKKIMEGLELVRSRIAQGGDPGDDNQQSEGSMLAAGARAG